MANTIVFVIDFAFVTCMVDFFKLDEVGRGDSFRSNLEQALKPVWCRSVFAVWRIGRTACPCVLGWFGQGFG